MANIFYETYQKKKEELFGKEEKKDRSFGEQFFWVYVCFGIATIVIHCISFAAAVVFPAFHIEVMFGSFSFGILLGLVLVFTLVEVPKYTFFKVLFENYFNYGIRSYEMAFAGVFFVSLSILSSIYGIPLVVEKFAPSAELISIEQIEQKYNEQKRTELALLSEQAKEAKEAEESYFNKYKKFDAANDRYRISSDTTIKKTYNALISAVTQADNALNGRVLELAALMDTDIKEAKEENKKRLELHTSQSKITKEVSFWVMLALELVYVLGCCGRAYYNYRREHEQPTEQDIEQDEQPKQKVVKRTKPTVQRVQTTNTNVAHAKVGFVQGEQNNTNDPTKPYHGKIVSIEGSNVPHVLYERKDGGFVEYKKSDIERRLRALSKKKEPNAPLTEYEIKLNDALKRFDNLK